ncbi:MAG: choice-of-anchor P family protein, partial [Nocardioidaceae bacterium]
DAKGVRSTVGWASDCDVSGSQDEGGDQPEQPGLPDGPPDPLTSLGAAITGKDRTADAEEPESGCALPQELAAVVDLGGMVSTSRTETVGNTVQATATSKLSDVAILGGVITADSISVTSTTTANGKKPTASGVSRVAGLELMGTPITVGRDGVQLADQGSKLPDLPDDPEKALAQLGLSLVLPKPERSARGDSGTAAFEGLQVVIDTRPLRSQLDDIPFDELTKQIPEETLRSLVGAATQLSPKFVITAGNTAAEAQTVPKMELDLDLPTVDPSELNGAAAPPSGAGTSGGVSAGGAGAAPALDGGAAAAGEAGASDALAVQPTSAGLPPLASIPGALMVGGLVMASGIGWWLQKIGGLVLGGAGSCSHGLETGVPDLRKA